MHAETSDSEHHQAIDALALLLENQESPADTAKAFTMVYENSIKTADRPTNVDSRNKVHTFWALWMCDAIRTFEGASKRLVDLLVEVSRQPDIIGIDRSPKKHIDGSIYWRDLPSWSFDFAEHGLS